VPAAWRYQHAQSAAFLIASSDFSENPRFLPIRPLTGRDKKTTRKKKIELLHRKIGGATVPPLLAAGLGFDAR
jgi:hypothetical protein